MKVRELTGTVLLTMGLGLMAPPIGAEFRDHDAHVHGVGRLNLVVESKTLVIELDTPSYDIVGFEHQPSTEAQHHAVEEAVEKLRDGQALFSFPTEAGCTLADVDVESVLMDSEHHDEDHHDDHHAKAHHDDHHGDDHHGDEHDHEHHAEEHDAEHHAEEHHGDHDGAEVHSEFAAKWTFSCTNPDALTHIDVVYFEFFSRSEELQVQAITATGQTAEELTPDAARLTLR